MKLNEQVDEGPLEHIAEWLRVAGRPSQALISIGATRYSDIRITGTDESRTVPSASRFSTTWGLGVIVGIQPKAPPVDVFQIF